MRSSREIENKAAQLMMSIIADEQFNCGGVVAQDKKMQVRQFLTSKEAADIQVRLYKVYQTFCKSLERGEARQAKHEKAIGAYQAALAGTYATALAWDEAGRPKELGIGGAMVRVIDGVKLQTISSPDGEQGVDTWFFPNELGEIEALKAIEKRGGKAKAEETAQGTTWVDVRRTKTSLQVRVSWKANC